jgi:hypothetical protein
MHQPSLGISSCDFKSTFSATSNLQRLSKRWASVSFARTMRLKMSK